MVADGQRDRITRLHTSPRPMPSERPAERVRQPEPVPAGVLASDYVATDRSTEQSRRRIAAVLSLPCAVCAASRGVYCFEGGHGFHIERWDKGRKLADSSLRPGDLEKMAAAVRNAERDRRIREGNSVHRAERGRR